MPGEHPGPSAADRELLAQVTELVGAMELTPLAVLEAATALHDWVDVDAQLAELVADPVLTRGDGTALLFAAGRVQVRAEIEPAGYRRRRLGVIVHDDAGTADIERVRVQFGDGATMTLVPDRFGDYAAEVPAGTLRAVVTVAGAAVTTAWFTV